MARQLGDIHRNAPSIVEGEQLGGAEQALGPMTKLFDLLHRRYSFD